jgi:hypothetical protein
MRFWLQNTGLLDRSGKVRDGLFVDDRRLRLSWLLDLRQVAAGQDREETRYHRLTHDIRDLPGEEPETHQSFP